MRPNSHLLLLTFLLIQVSGFSQIVKSYGGIVTEIPRAIVQLPDSGFIINGTTRSYGPTNTNIYTLRLDKYGDTLWTRVTGLGNEDGYGIQLASGQRFITANSQFFLGYGGCHVEQWDYNGNLIWSRGYSTPNSSQGRFICNAPSDQIMIAGEDMLPNTPYSSIALFMLDSTGSLQWVKRYGGAGYEALGDFALCENGGYIIAGTTSSYNNASNGVSDAMLIRIDNQGDTLWSKRYETAPYAIGIEAVAELGDGGFVFAGSTNAYGAGLEDILLVRCDSAGDTLWTRTFGGTYPEYNTQLLVMDDGGFLITAQTSSFTSNNQWDIYMIRTDANGDTLWTKTIGGSVRDVPRDLIRTSDGGVAILAQSESWNATGISFDYDVSLILLDSTLNTPCFYSPVPTQVGYAPFLVASFSPQITSGGGQASHSPPITSGATITTFCDPLGVASDPAPHENISLYPNPAAETFTVQLSSPGATLQLYNSTGALIRTASTSGNKIEVNLQEEAQGIYFCRVTRNDGSVWMQKVVH